MKLSPQNTEAVASVAKPTKPSLQHTRTHFLSLSLSLSHSNSLQIQWKTTTSSEIYTQTFFAPSLRPHPLRRTLTNLLLRPRPLPSISTLISTPHRSPPMRPSPFPLHLTSFLPRTCKHRRPLLPRNRAKFPTGNLSRMRTSPRRTRELIRSRGR